MESSETGALGDHNAVTLVRLYTLQNVIQCQVE